ncbi:MAG: Coenzyme F420 hydrogenase/dehydrogenase, beta subunit C-terminal domain [Proteobacteria bacterium]|nr:Coenzyme F420 hydrogenase/dehydrogenase, beta subunit C-terminal domain [Pseudomonadota bacterium]
MRILGSSELCEDVQKKDLCVDCGACAGLCPYFVSHKGKIARLFPCTLPQGRCHAFCPKTEIDLNHVSETIVGKSYDGSPLGHMRAIWKTRAGRLMQGKGAFQNGGTASSLLVAAMASGLIDAAALTRRKGLIPEPFLATSTDQILSCAGSKYMASPTLASVHEYSREKGQKLAVVGTPCQMTALGLIRMNPLGREDFHDPVALSMGLFCTWALDTRRLIRLIENRVNLQDIQSMDVPPPPSQVMTIRTCDQNLAIPLDEIRTAIPAGCSICPDMTAEFTDLSVGALEGDPSWNTLIVRTEKGESLVEEAVRQGYLERDAMRPEHLEHLRKGASAKKKRAFIMARDKHLLNTDPAKGPSALIIKEDLVKKLLGEEGSCLH